MRIAVVGSGISGLASAWLLSRMHEVVLFESDTRLGGHTHTHDVHLQGRDYRIDTGFIVSNRAHYPLLNRMFDELGVRTRPTTMSFAVHSDASGVEYNATDLDRLFCQRRNLASPRFLRMVGDLLRFYRQAPALLRDAGPGPTLGDYLESHHYGEAFRDEHIVPMASALWSAPSAQVLQFPARYLVQFMANHQMLQVAARPTWQVVEGGSSSYIDALMQRWNVQVRNACPVLRVRRDDDGVQVMHANGIERFDRVVLACHSDQALALLEDADAREHAVLDALAYQRNDVVLHTDASLLPRNRRAWAAWNVHVPRTPADDCTVSYCMNQLQGIDAPETFVVTLNRSDAIDPARVIARMQYAHPVYSHASVAARARKAEIQGVRGTYFAGAYWGWGFHEDGMRSAVEVADALGAPWMPAAGTPSIDATRLRGPRAIAA